MRILIVSNLFPPVARGGYEVECSAVVERLRSSHDVLVLTSSAERSRARADGRVWRELPLLTPDRRGAVRAPLAALHSVRAARRALSWSPEFVYVWNGSSIGQSALRVLAQSGVPTAFRVCEHWFAHLFAEDQFLRELLPAPRGPARAAWAAACRTINLLPSMRLDPLAPMRTAISWNSETLHRMVPVPPSIEPLLERVGHSVPAHGDLYAGVIREPAPEPEILFVGRVTPYKGISVAIEALALLRSEHAIAATLVVAGPEDRVYAKSMRELAARLGVAEAVLWRGQVAPEEVARALARAHALIMPSLWEEPFPLVTIEAAMAHVPLVAADVGGVSEGMQDEDHALLFPRGDAAMAAAALARTLREAGPTAARVQRARERAEAFRIGPYLDEQERFVADACAILRRGAPTSAPRDPRNAPKAAV
jgi:glycosyltransferase involved in cell wall biosynthesis